MAYKTPTTQTGKKLYQKENEGREENELSPEVRMAQKTCSRETPHGSHKTAPLLTDRGPRTDTREASHRHRRDSKESHRCFVPLHTITVTIGHRQNVKGNGADVVLWGAEATAPRAALSTAPARAGPRASREGTGRTHSVPGSQRR